MQKGFLPLVGMTFAEFFLNFKSADLRLVLSKLIRKLAIHISEESLWRSYF